ncbi:hypothetical protein NL676_017724 [Syzygium grande]|nr:hypothetical protein NL676_017724 [Syzygium grande]
MLVPPLALEATSTKLEEDPEDFLSSQAVRDVSRRASTRLTRRNFDFTCTGKERTDAIEERRISLIYAEPERIP